ncbi:MAG: hypothetical protein ABH840_00745 [Nanoarchaeota archaeon]
MKIKKGLSILVIGVFIFFILGCNNVHASLGLSPAIVETDFEPDLSFLVNFRVIGADSSQKLEVYAEGDFSKYVQFDKTNLTGVEGFTAYINLPLTAEKPGKNKLYIRVREVVEKSSGIGTRLEIGALILIKVPYPGKYAEIKSFSISDANEGEPVNFNLEVESLGAEEVYVAPNIKVYANDEMIEDINFDGRTINPRTSETFIRNSGENYRAGIYNATATVDYREIIKQNTSFRIGSLFVNITNWSSTFLAGKISEFKIDIESKWNDDIRNVYAEVNVSKDSTQVDSFKTPSIELKRWEKASLKGFFSSENLEKGVYDADITLFYEGKKTEKSVEISVVNPPVNTRLIILISGVCVVLVLLVVVIIYLLFRRNKNKKK